MTVVYEVNLTVDPDVAARFRSWLPTHVEEVCRLSGFIGAEVLEVIEPSGAHRAYRISYTVRDQDALSDYLRDHAPRMRQDGISRFGDRFGAVRRILGTLRSED